MQIYLVRHAQAESGDIDVLWPLSEKGKAQIREVGRRQQKARAVQAKEIWHSPLVRSRTTAERLGKRLRSKAKLRLMDGLAPGDAFAGVARRLDQAREPVMVVGHEPHLSALATFLMTR